MISLGWSCLTPWDIFLFASPVVIISYFMFLHHLNWDTKSDRLRIWSLMKVRFESGATEMVETPNKINFVDSELPTKPKNPIRTNTSGESAQHRSRIDSAISLLPPVRSDAPYGTYSESPPEKVVGFQWTGLTEVLCNVLGTLGFVVGSLLWVLGSSTHGTVIFAGACILCGISCTIYAVRFYAAGDLIGVYALLQQAVGCVVFTICSFLFLYEEYLRISLIGFYTGSFLFLTGCVLTQIQYRTWCGAIAPIIPYTNLFIIPTSLFNTIGSALFVTGSVFLFYPWGQIAGGWCYEVGSIVFFLASWGDATIWCNRCCNLSMSDWLHQ